ncbi:MULTISPECIES: restriction endonuclease subunit S [Francisella]|uniref:Restriction endonuclease subunit S n=1 Tax=Francisella opportunistica TaxID=2016517 RepID=A0A345JQL6_9GAMM|nr:MULTISPECIES: restriction endonuclease subunit S [Francisella]APC91317.1 Type I restriction-modification system, specificity subunit S [Francisella sp. MA067296]AXH29612.1 restriction endonuclease subunit S [Francisella opportunistica]AXH31263.1 type I restriction endonuclease subunit S [Francisella opportunistica]AXH32910.1 type I restriction endonuclease subunit S [Francisella opportunistica]
MAEYKLDSSVDSNRIFLVDYSELQNRIDPHSYHRDRFDVIYALEKIECKSLKRVAKFSKRITNKVSDGDIYIGLENIESNTGSYIKTEAKESISSANIFKKNQILFPKLRPYLNKVYLATFDGLCSTEFHVLESALDSLNNKYLYIYLQSNLVVSQTKHLMTGNTLPRLQTEDIKNILIPLPSPEIQKQIVQKYEQAYQQKQQKEQKAKELLASIDSYLLDKLGIELPEKDNSLQARIFTTNFSEVSGGRCDVQDMKNSFLKVEGGIFNNVCLKDLCSIKKGQSITSSNIEDGKYPVIAGGKTSPYNHKYFNYNQEVITISASGAYSGYVWYHDYPIFASDCSVLWSKDEQLVSNKYIFEILKLKQDDIYSLQQGAGQPHVYASDLMKVKIPLPPLTPAQAKAGEISQQEIVEHISAIRAEAKQLQQEAIADLEATKAEIEKMILG